MELSMQTWTFEMCVESTPNKSTKFALTRWTANPLRGLSAICFKRYAKKTGRVTLKKYFLAFAFILAGCASGLPESTENNYVPPKERKLFDPTFINGQLTMPRGEWFHNFKATAIPGLCSDPRAGFLRVYKGKPSKCEMEIEPILDFCLEKLSENYIPETLVGIGRANSYGQSMGQCLIINYQHKIKNA